MENCVHEAPRIVEITGIKYFKMVFLLIFVFAHIRPFFANLVTYTCSCYGIMKNIFSLTPELILTCKMQLM